MHTEYLISGPYLFLDSGADMDAVHRRPEDRCEAEKGEPEQDTDRVRADAVRDPHGRHPREELQAEEGRGARGGEGRRRKGEMVVYVKLARMLCSFTGLDVPKV